MKLLITGGAGFIGSNLCEYFVNNGYDVVCLDNLSTGFRHNIEPLMSKPNFRFIEGDIRDLETCREAVKQIHVPFHEIIIDGTINFLRDTQLSSHVQVLTKADLLVPEVSAASIVAKVARDNYMYKLAEKYPGYGFEKHVGYGTAAHRKALEELGVCPEHRKSFRPIAEMLDISSAKKSSKSTKAKGDRGETAVCDYLVESGHEIVARNWKNKFCEIDIISKFNGVLCFTEVKYRRAGAGLDTIDKKKLEKMRFAAEFYLAQNGGGAAILAAAEVSGDNYKVTDFLVLQ